MLVPAQPRNPEQIGQPRAAASRQWCSQLREDLRRGSPPDAPKHSARRTIYKINCTAFEQLFPPEARISKLMKTRTTEHNTRKRSHMISPTTTEKAHRQFQDASNTVLLVLLASFFNMLLWLEFSRSKKRTIDHDRIGKAIRLTDGLGTSARRRQSSRFQRQSARTWPIIR